MELTEEVLAPFVGGQIEVQNTGEGYLYRGEIASIEITGAANRPELKVKLNWMAEAVGFPTFTGNWKVSDRLDYTISLMIYLISDIGDDRIMLNSHIVGEMTVLFPKGGSTLDPAKVEGLELSA